MGKSGQIKLKRECAYQRSKTPRDETENDSEPHEGIEVTKHVIEELAERIRLMGADLVPTIKFQRMIRRFMDLFRRDLESPPLTWIS